MSLFHADMRDGAPIGAEELLARAAAVESCARARLSIAIDDFFLPDQARLDERRRAALSDLLAGLVAAIEAAVRDAAVRLLAARGAPALAEALAAGEPIQRRLADAGLLRDPLLMGELIARVEQGLIGAGLPAQLPAQVEQPGLLARLLQHPDPEIAAAARAMIAAESWRRETDSFAHTGLPTSLQRQLTWWVAAALRDTLAEAPAVLDTALSEAAGLSLAGYDEGVRLEAAALRLAALLDPEPDALAELLVDALGDRRLALFVALLAQALGIGYDSARALVLDAEGVRLWLVLWALGLSRETIAWIGYALCEADARRGLERFADTLDAVTALDPGQVRVVLAMLQLDPAYVAARHALRHGGGGV